MHLWIVLFTWPLIARQKRRLHDFQDGPIGDRTSGAAQRLVGESRDEIKLTGGKRTRPGARQCKYPNWF